MRINAERKSSINAEKTDSPPLDMKLSKEYLNFAL
jgi:hypothetical protein